MNSPQELIRLELQKTMTDLANACYDDMYSSANYEPRINLYRTKCGVLLDLCKHLNIDAENLVGQYCNYEVEVNDIVSFEDQDYWV